MWPIAQIFAGTAAAGTGMVTYELWNYLSKQ